MKKQYIQPSVKNHKLIFESALAAGSPTVEIDNYDGSDNGTYPDGTTVGNGDDDEAG